MLLVSALRHPARLLSLGANDWAALLRLARAEALLGQLDACVTEAGVRDTLPERVRTILDDHAIAVTASQRGARWEARMTAQALASLDCPVVLLKGGAYVAAGLAVAAGRTVGDLDILLPRDRLDDAERLLKGAGWSSLKDDPYDDEYYRRWMHELPPLVNDERGTVLDLHHTILPLTARRRPDAAALLASAIPAGPGLAVLAAADMLLHSVAHAFADGEFDGGLRNVWDIHRLIGEFAPQPGFWADLAGRAHRHELETPLARSLRAAADLFGTDVDPALAGRCDSFDRLIRSRLLARDHWGRATRPLIRRSFYLRSHLLRMPLRLLVPHLWRKWRMAQRSADSAGSSSS